jgi:hypothetical protein
VAANSNLHARAGSSDRTPKRRCLNIGPKFRVGSLRSPAE